MDVHIETTMPYSAHAIANEILHKAWEMGVVITHLKLQKLVYLAHALHLAIKKKPLIFQEVQAWKYGPVISELYDSCSDFGKEPIDVEVCRLEVIDDEPVCVTPRIQQDQAIENLTTAVLSKYGELNGGQLVSLTHEPGSAWHVMEEYHQGGSIRDVIIPIEVIGETEGKHLLFEEYLNRM